MLLNIIQLRGVIDREMQVAKQYPYGYSNSPTPRAHSSSLDTHSLSPLKVSSYLRKHYRIFVL